jgi:hypothetical protein
MGWLRGGLCSRKSEQLEVTSVHVRSYTQHSRLPDNALINRHLVVKFEKKRSNLEFFAASAWCHCWETLCWCNSEDTILIPHHTIPHVGLDQILDWLHPWSLCILPEAVVASAPLVVVPTTWIRCESFWRPIICLQTGIEPVTIRFFTAPRQNPTKHLKVFTAFAHLLTNYYIRSFYLLSISLKIN